MVDDAWSSGRYGVLQTYFKFSMQLCIVLLLNGAGLTGIMATCILAATRIEVDVML
jgi:hypothetical protein